MKYIVMQRKIGTLIREVPILFPNELVHQHVAKALLNLPGNPYQFVNKVVSAGDVVISINTVSCYGLSETLRSRSRGEQDATLIEMCEYGVGVKSTPADTASADS